MLLHGLCGHAGEWAETASRLSASYRVVAPEQRGHGRSERNPADASRKGFVGDGKKPASWTLSRDPSLLETSIPGIFVVGDVRPRLGQTRGLGSGRGRRRRPVHASILGQSSMRPAVKKAYRL